MKPKKLIIFGTGQIAELASHYFTTDSNYIVVAFTVDRQYCVSDSFLDKPLIPFEKLESELSIVDHEMFIALSYAKMNRLREQKYMESKNKGYIIASYVSSKCSYLSQFPPGENSFILEDNTIQPFVKIGDNVILWSGNHVGHHSEIASNNFISSHVVISGNCLIESYCFLGVNSTITHNIKIVEGSLIGAGAVISKNTEKNGVYVAPRPVKLPKDSTKMSL